MKTTETIGGRDCTIYTMDGAQILLLQPVDDHDQSLLDSEVELICSHTDAPFNMVAFGINDWMSELTPWPAPPTFGKQPFGDGAEMTLGYVKNVLIPTLQERWGAMKVVLGGYSLAGLFALWAGYNSDICDGIAAASPSVWYPQWTVYIDRKEMHSDAVYLSLGDREFRTKNPVMAHVDDAIRKQHELVSAQGIETVLEWNPGGHFIDSEKRMARAFGWVCEVLNNGMFYKENPDDQIYWIDNPESKGEHLFSFDKKTIFNLFADYPYKLTKEQKEIFDKENPYWADFFKDRN